jgi:hypothetical protein
LASFYFFKDAKIFAYDMAKLFRNISESETPKN